MTTATAYSWLVAQGLWPTALGGLLYWAVPAIAAFVLSKRVLGRAYREVVDLWRAHIKAQAAQAEHLEAISTHLQTLAVRPVEPDEEA